MHVEHHQAKLPASKADLIHHESFELLRVHAQSSVHNLRPKLMGLQQDLRMPLVPASVSRYIMTAHALTVRSLTLQAYFDAVKPCEVYRECVSLSDLCQGGYHHLQNFASPC